MLELLNRYAHGLVAVPILHALRARGCLARMAEAPFDAATLARAYGANAAYLNVSIRMLLCLDWIRLRADGRYEATPDLAHASAIPAEMIDLYDFPFDRYVQGSDPTPLDPWLERVARRWDSDHPALPDYLDGVVIIPLLLALEAQRQLQAGEPVTGDDRATLRLDVAPAVGAAIARLFVAKHWAVESTGVLTLTRAGRFIVDRILITGTVASYRPMLGRAAELLFGDDTRVFALDAAGHETHLERTLNVTASGFQHEKYFVALGEMIVRLFDHDAFDAQPKYIVDIGCGDGTLLRRIYETVRDRTRRGKVLDRYPLVPIAADRHAKALAAAARTLEGIEHLTVSSEIGDPLGLLESLRARGIADLDRILHVRSFMDHNREAMPPQDRAAAARRPRCGGSNVYIHADGTSIAAADMIQSTVEHLRRWTAVANTHGLIVLEVHCLTPDVTARYLDESESFHFDLYHALSHQYLLEAQTFLLCAAEAGLFCGAGEAIGFPRHLPFTRITLNHFERRPYVVRHASAGDIVALPALRQTWPAQWAHESRDGRDGRGARELPSPIDLLREVGEGQFVLEADGEIAAVICCARDRAASASAVRIAAIFVRAGCRAQHVLELLLFVEQYWAYSGGTRLLGLDDCRAAISPARALARDVAARVAGYPFDAKDDPRAAERELGAFAFRWLLAILQRMGVMREAGEVYDLDQLERQLGVAAKYHVYFEALMRRLEGLGLLTRHGRRLETTAQVCGYALSAIDDDVAAFSDSFRLRYPACAGLLNFTAACLRRYDEILSGRIDITDVMFKDGDMGVFAEIFRGDVVSDYFNRIVADLLRGAVTRAGGRPVRILEIGAGTGGTTVAILDALRPHAGTVSFCFSDISLSFVRHARRLFADAYPSIEYRTLNIDEDLAPQGFEPQTFDIIVAANVLHDTRDIEVTLARTRSLLRPGGLLILNEYTSVKDCLCFSGALLHGWWLFEDPARRQPDSCLLSVPQWASALEHAGFALVAPFVLPTQQPDGACSQSVMLCESDGEPIHAPARASQPAQEDPMSIARGDRPEGEGSDRSGILAAWTEREIVTLLGEGRGAAYDARRPLMEMGLDSIELVELKLFLEQRFGVKLTSAFFFEHETPERIVAALTPQVKAETLAALSASAGEAEGSSRDAHDRRDAPVAASGRKESAASAPDPNAMAIVGIACRFPGGASSPDAFWRLLEGAEPTIGPMPSGRWQWPATVDLHGKQRGIDQSGFLARIDEFDAAFFRTSPREAELMDPQQRLLLELSWEALEDAGHRPSEWSGRPVGVFVGACHYEYRELLAASGHADAYVGSGGAPSMLANRLSYFYDLKGPSLTVDTACSSALSALHAAVRALRRGECEQALVGAVNLLCSPTNTLAYHQAGMLSASGVCRAFDAAADGFVRGEGGAMLVIKPLAAAVADGDAIYGVITGTAVNHGGQAASLTAPKPEAQAAVVEAAWREAGAPPESAGYIETHGTGTRLGDPVEITGLIEAFARLSRASGDGASPQAGCGLGSVKTNIGHLEGAAGLAGLIKVLLAMRHRAIPGTLNFTQLNPEIDLRDTPFHIVARQEPWPEPRDAQGRAIARRAGVSSFGFGGANAHVVVEEYRPQVNPSPAVGMVLVPLSARTADQLIATATRLLDVLSLNDATTPAAGMATATATAAAAATPAATAGAAAADVSLRDLAYTLQVGREPMSERLALIVDSRDALVSLLRRVVAGDAAIPNVHRGTASRRLHPHTSPSSVDTSLARGDLATLASLWCAGADIDWNQLYRDQTVTPRRVHLPTYPFDRERFWIAAPAETAASAVLHPLVHRNTSDLDEQRYSSTFTPQEWLLADHRVRGHRWLPGVAYLEMARDAVARAAGTSVVALKRFIWLRPLEVRAEPVDVHIALLPGERGEIAFEIYSRASGDDVATADEDILHARGVAIGGTAPEAPSLDVAMLATRYQRNHYPADTCYAAFSARGLDYGPAYRGLEGVHVDGDEAIARLALPSAVSVTREAFILHPSLLDAALQATMAFDLARDGSPDVAVPFELQAVELFRPCPSRLWAVVRRAAAAGGSTIASGLKRFDLDLADEEGRLCVHLRGVSMRRIDSVDAIALAGEAVASGAGDAATTMATASSAVAGIDVAGVDVAGLERELRAALAQTISTLLLTPLDRITADAQFSALGFDSIAYAEWSEHLKADYGIDVMPTVFFEHPTLERFARFLIARHQDVLAARFAAQHGPASVSVSVPDVSLDSARRARRSRRPDSARRGLAAAAPAREPIAIVGLSGRFPMAGDVDALWDNLVHGRDCIREIPPERWDWRAVSRDASNGREHTSIGFAGLIDGVDEFDPQFFNISPREAQLMDPQQRLLMIYIWKAIEDAGHAPSSLSGSDTGIFVGTGLSDYDLLVAQSGMAIDAYTATGTVSSVGPNRMSYFLNLHGPSEPIETLCSSSLVAIHRAVEAIRNGQCAMAIAGGVNTIVTPDLHISCDRAGMLSADGRCKTFSDRADGYVRSEGIGILFLKTLAAAEAAGDHIYGVILGSAENHGGRSASFSAPNPEAQAALLRRAYTEAGVDPASVSYIEAHGTGTSLGDPIEIEGLKTAFRDLHETRGTAAVAGQCGLGSVKSNIGHLELAAGVAGVIKVLLQMRHATLVPTLHCESVNPYIQLDGSPFYLVRERTAWPARRDVDGTGTATALPRRAGVSAFGYGGVNAHVVLEEYVPRAMERASNGPGARPVAIVLSARDGERLRAQAEALLAAVVRGQFANGDLVDLAYTLQVGRDAMDERVGFLAGSIGDLDTQLQRVVRGEDGRGIHRGHARRNEDVLAVLGADDEFESMVDRWIAQGRSEKLLELWVKGLKLDWARLYSDPKPSRLSAPTYAFARERYWVTTPPPALATPRTSLSASGASGASAFLHPLVQRNTSDLVEQRYSTIFTGHEAWLADHRVAGRRWLPGMAYLEMAREAVSRAAAAPVRGLSRVVWLRPLAVDADPVEVHIAVLPGEGEGEADEIAFEIYSGDTLHARGAAVMGVADDAPRLDVTTLATRYRQITYTADACYAAFAARGIEYGPGSRGLEAMHVASGEVIARIALPATAAAASVDVVHAAGDPLVLHPGLLDSALHAIMGFELARGGAAGLMVPFELQAVEIFGACPARAWTVVRRAAAAAEADGYDLDVCGEDGRVCVRLRGLRTRRVDGAEADASATSVAPMEPALPPAPIETGVLRRQVEAALMHMASTVLLLPLDKITATDEFSALGFDSIALAELTGQIEIDYGLDLMPTVFFEHPTIERFARYLTEKHESVMLSHLGPRRDAAAVGPAASAAATAVASASPSSSTSRSREARRSRGQRFATTAGATTATTTTAATGTLAATAAGAHREAPEPIAIVGISGRFPMAPDVDALWDNLLHGRDGVAEIPAERWDWRAVYGDAGQPHKTPIKWGGFIDGVDEFDPLFFNVSPREAQLMDPQQRLLMIHIWKAIEDAGYAPSSLSGSNTGIFVGTGSSDYSQLIARSDLSVEGYTGMGTMVPVGPNRVSYLLNLHGPSEPIDTMCSSSLVAIHRAVGAIRTGQCDMAIVGGVNTILTPDQHISYSKAGMLGADGRCKTFSDRADGFGRGEGVGILLLKTLRAAEAAGDHIYATILSSAENHGGRAASFSAPNPHAQAALLRRAYTEAGIDPASVGYIEAHGTGTALGDPIEIDGLKTAFRELSQDRGVAPVPGHCGLGSVKSNIGHLELAAGVAGVIKVLLQLRHATLAPTLHCDTVNPYIQLEGSPFYLVREPMPWPSRRDAAGAIQPRRAGVSALGFGGVNAHVVLEEYVPRASATAVRLEAPTRPVVIVLSARDQERLRDQASALLAAVRGGQFAETFQSADLIDIAYTLQVGRDAMDERLGFLAGSISELEEKLHAFLDGDLAGASPRGDKGAAEAVRRLTADEDFRVVVDGWIEQGRWEKLLELWLKGMTLDWSRLYGVAKPRRVSLPTYPFARNRYWIPRAPAAAAPAAHAMLSPRETEVLGYRSTTVLSGDEFFLADHVIQGRRVLPAVVYLELARAAAERAAIASAASGMSLRSVSWLRPFIVGATPSAVHVRLTRESGDDLSFQVEGDPASGGRGPIVYAHGRVGPGLAAAVAVMDLAAVRARCEGQRYSADACYAAFAAIGYHYGPAQRGIRELYVSSDELLARLTLPPPVADTLDGFVLHPALADASLQAAIGFLLAQRRDPDEPITPALPFELQRVDILRPCSETMWAWLRRVDGTFDIDLCDDTGRLSARFSGWITRPMEGGLPAVHAVDAGLSDGISDGEMILAPEWEPVTFNSGTQVTAAAAPASGVRLATIGATDAQLAAMARLYPQARAIDVQVDASVEQLAETFPSADFIDHLVWVVPASRSTAMDDEALIAGQREGVRFGFRLIKALLAAGYGDRALTVSVVTTATQPIRTNELTSPTHAGVHGLIGSLAKEYPAWIVRLFDLPSSGEWPWQELFTVPTEPHGNALVYRDRQWHRQQLVPHGLAGEATALGRPGDVYVVIGGAGGIGSAWTEVLMRRSRVQFVWIGRRPKDHTLQATLDRLAEIGPPPLYIEADATNREQLEQARATILRTFGRIDGLIHAAFVLADHSLANMTEEEFTSGLTPKIDVCVRLAQVFRPDPIGFVLFVSSLNAFVKSAGQSNYVAGCAFEDAFARRLASEWPCRVRVINFGYWGSVGAVASDRYRTAMARKGIGSIEAPEATRVLDHLLAGSTPQLAYLKTIGRPAIEGIPVRLPATPGAAAGATAATSSPSPSSSSRDAAVAPVAVVAEDIMARPRDAAIADLVARLRLWVAQELGVEAATLDGASRPFAQALLGEFGMDSLTSSNLRNTLRRELTVDVSVQCIISERVQHIANTIYDQLLLQRVSAAPEAGDEDGRETYVF